MGGAGTGERSGVDPPGAAGKLGGPDLRARCCCLADRAADALKDCGARTEASHGRQSGNFHGFATLFEHRMLIFPSNCRPLTLEVAG
jgi:hypothetical protein